MLSPTQFYMWTILSYRVCDPKSMHTLTALVFKLPYFKQTTYSQSACFGASFLPTPTSTHKPFPILLTTVPSTETDRQKVTFLWILEICPTYQCRSTSKYVLHRKPYICDIVLTKNSSNAKSFLCRTNSS